MDNPGRLQKLTHIVRTSLRDLFDQEKPFGRLAAVHTLMSAGTTAVAVGLAGTLFFSISAKAAETKVLLYLLITVAPFAVVAPALSPLLDRGRQARRTAVVIAAAGSAVACFLMTHSTKGLLLFPEAFGFLVLSKLYMITRAALVPAIVGENDDLASANAKLAVLAALAGFAVSPLAIGFLQISASVVMGFAGVIFVATTVGAFRLPKPASDRATGRRRAHDRHGGVQPSAYREVPGLVDDDVLVPPDPTPAQFPTPQVAAATSAPHLPPGGIGEQRGATSASHGGRRRGMQLYPASVLSALTAMSVVRGSVGFVTFFLAFALKRENAATWWYGFIVLASGIGGLAGSMVVPRLRRRLSEESIILASLVLAAALSFVTAFIGGLWAQPLLTFVICFAGTTAKPSFDSIVQRDVPPLMQGRAFARFETRLQLVWVGAALLAVVIDFSFGGGDVVVGVACAIAAVFYASMRHTVHQHDVESRRGRVGGQAPAAP